jgi:hypothetical protein
MSITSQEKVETFEQEIKLIFDKKVKEFVRLCLIQAPDYIFENCPSSSSGKFHPIDELGTDGTIIHTKKIVTLAYELSRGFDCVNSRDLVVAAAIIHDLVKYGPGRGTGHTVKEHPAYGVALVDEVQGATQLLTEEQYKIIRDCIGYHYGPWSIDPWKKPIDSYTREEMVVYTADYIVSRRFIGTDYRRKDW